MIIPTFQEIDFDKENHLYSYRGTPLRSVTQVVGSLKPPFDTARLSASTARKRGVPVDVILKEWEDAGRIGREKGTLVHSYVDTRAHNQAWAGERLPEMDGFDSWHESWGSQLAFRRLEWIVGYPDIGVAGTVDALAWDTQTNTYQVWDWKTGKFDTTNDWGKSLLPPFSDLEECRFMSYSLQVSLYRLILSDCGGIQTSAGFILHLQSDGGWQVYQTIDFRDRLREWLS